MINLPIHPIRLESKIILLTGGYGYLGRAITASLAYHGATVVILGRDQEKFNIYFEESDDIAFRQTDISSSESIAKSFNQIFTEYGKIDAVINNAFYLSGQSPEEMNDQDWENGIDGTLSSVFRSIREIIPIFKKQKYGKIINVSSMYGIVAPNFDAYNDFPEFLNPPHYGAAKAGVIQLTRYYASYLGKWNILVNTVTPGPFPSEVVKKKSKFINELEALTCLNRIGQPEDLAGIFSFLTSDAANFITGQNFVIDGGWTIK